MTLALPELALLPKCYMLTASPGTCWDVSPVGHFVDRHDDVPLYLLFLIVVSIVTLGQVGPNEIEVLVRADGTQEPLCSPDVSLTLGVLTAAKTQKVERNLV